MQQSMIRFVLLLSIVITTGCTAPSFEDRIDALLTPYQSPQPGLAMRLVRGEQVVIERTIGLAELDSLQTVGATTNFRLASITKHLTALAILMLIEDGRLTLDTRLNAILPQISRIRRANLDPTFVAAPVRITRLRAARTARPTAAHPRSRRCESPF